MPGNPCRCCSSPGYCVCRQAKLQLPLQHLVHAPAQGQQLCCQPELLLWGAVVDQQLQGSLSLVVNLQDINT